MGEITTASLDYVAAGPVKVDTGNPYLDIFGVVFIVLALAWGFRLINRGKGSKSE